MKIREEQIDPIDGIKPILTAWHYLGLWPGNSNKTKYGIYAAAIHLPSTYFIATTAFLSIFIISDVSNSTESLYVSLTEASYMLKATFVIFRWHKLQKLIDNMRAHLRIISYHPEEYHLIKKGISLGNKVYYFLVVMFVTAGTLVSLKAIFTKNYSLQFSSVYPYDWSQTKTRYWGTFLFQAVGVIIQVTVNAGIDTIPASILCVLGGYCDAFSYNIKRIGNIQAETQNNELEKLHLKRLGRQYHHICRVAKRTEELFSEIMFIHYCFIGVILCTTLYELTIVSFYNIVKTSFLISYSISMLFEVFIPCYYGNEIILKTGNFLNEISNSNWRRLNIKVKKDLIILMQFFQKPIKLSAGKLFYLQLRTLTSILNSAYSFYTVLRSTTRK